MRYLSFGIGNEFFGIPLEQVREVIAFPHFKPVPDSPDYFLGIMSLRSEVISVLDLRIKLSLEPTLTQDTSVIICDLGGRVFGVVVDVIHTVVAPTEEQIMEASSFHGHGGGSHNFIKNIVRHDKQLTLVLDMSNILSAEEVSLIDLRGGHQDSAKFQ